MFFNAIHNTTQVSDVSAIDLMTGAPLVIKEVTGAQARAAGLKDADARPHYLQVQLARPVPEGGEVRIRIHKTYKDASTYHRDGDAVVFSRDLTVRRDAIVLPKGYEIVGANVPVQVIEEADGRIAASLMNIYPGAAPFVLRARAVAPRAGLAPPAAAAAPPADGAGRCPPRETAMNQVRVSERAVQDREIVYFLKQPETHAFSLYHDYTASREGGASVRQRRPRGQQRVGAVREDPRHR